MRQDVVYALRRFAKSPGFAAAAIFSLALGVGANSTIFSLVSRFVLRPPPVGDPSTLLSLHTTQRGECCNQFTWPLLEDVRRQAHSFSGLAAYVELLPASIAGSSEPERIWGQAATSNFFDVAQLPMAVGRGFLTSEERLPVVVLGYNLWQRHFGGDPAIAGKSVLLSGQPYTVVGVASPYFVGLDQILYSQFWIPLSLADQLQPHTTNFESRDFNWLAVAGRLAPGVSRDQAAAELQVISRRVSLAHPESDQDRGFRFEQAGALPPRDRSFVLTFLAALTAVVLLVLLIACANVANLLLAQAAARGREMSVRRALGATRGRLFRHMLVESLLLALAGGSLSVAFSRVATSALSAISIPSPVPLHLAIPLDWRTLLYTFVLSAAAGLLLGLLPALAAIRGEIAPARPSPRWTLRNLLVVAQIAMSLVLLCATGLFLRSLQGASSIDLGFRSNGGFLMAIDPRLNGYTAERTVQLLADVRRRVAALPGVLSVACTDMMPLSGAHRSEGFRVAGGSSPATAPSVDLFMATPGYFDALGIPRIAGRDFADESPSAPKVVVINQTLARSLFPAANPIGRSISGAGVTYQIIGVVKDIKSRTLGEAVRPVLFRSLSQSIAADPSFMGYSILVRSASHSAALAAEVRRQIHTLDPSLAIFNSETLEQHFRSALFLPRLTGALFAVFGSVGLLLAAVGLYGVMSYSISRRTREIGIRVALGSPIGSVQRLIIRQGMILASIAVAIGLSVAWAIAKFAAGMLYNVAPHDALTFTVVPLFLGAVALLASWLPARRAGRVDPLIALRHE